MDIEWISYILAFFSMLGFYYNAHHRSLLSYAVWLGTNIGWVVFDWVTGAAMGNLLLFAAYAFQCIYYLIPKKQKGVSMSYLEEDLTIKERMEELESLIQRYKNLDKMPFTLDNNTWNKVRTIKTSLEQYIKTKIHVLADALDDVLEVEPDSE